MSLTEKELMTADARTVAGLPDCVIEDLAQYHDVECACVYCSELRWRETRVWCAYCRTYVRTGKGAEEDCCPTCKLVL